MEFSSLEQSEKSGKQKLMELEKQNRYLFHGSGIKTEFLEPRQAHNYPEKDMSKRIPDGEPAVFASDIANVAIFRAVVNKENTPKGLRSGFGFYGAGPQFRATKETMDQIKNARGYVYVFDRDNFRQRDEGSNEWVSLEPVTPIETIEVNESDLPENIKIEDF